ncbi:hypothetical protein [Bifidobacterium platyrrhinorum]|uniref:Uncharacterized protein n=1 Tax=Bifidobacterium platyrrhinorum TaxID=2661628 RepID=A0A6L9SPN4_9BIFI|nr:hypothetical protein [Bifidobacterium platyrrhinorum]NEG54487.1 hypothetical protein [Bifidobacterium platyrrhinorum]
MVNVALNAASTIVEFTKKNRNNILVLMYAITTINWLVVALLRIHQEREDKLDAAGNEGIEYPKGQERLVA